MQGLVERVTVIFYDKAHVPVEKFVFKLAVNQSYGSKLEEANLEFALRAFLIKLTVAEPVTKPVPPGSPTHPVIFELFSTPSVPKCLSRLTFYVNFHHLFY
jgi:hypothetical protein